MSQFRTCSGCGRQHPREAFSRRQFHHIKPFCTACIKDHAAVIKLYTKTTGCPFYKYPISEVHRKSFFLQKVYQWSQLSKYKPGWTGFFEPDYRACYLLIMRFLHQHVHLNENLLPNSLHKDHVARLASKYWITEQVVGVPCLVLCSHDGGGIFTAEIKVDKPELAQVQFHIEARCAANLEAIKGRGLVFKADKLGDLLVFSDVLASSTEVIPLDIGDRVAYMQNFITQTKLRGARVKTFVPCPQWNAKLQHCFEYPTDGVALTPIHSTSGDPIIWRPIPVFRLLVATWLFEQDPQTGNVLYHVFALLLVDVPKKKKGEPISNILKNCVQVGLAEVPFEQRRSPSSLCIAEFHYDGEYGESLPFAVNAPGGSGHWYFESFKNRARWIFLRFRGDVLKPQPLFWVQELLNHITTPLDMPAILGRPSPGDPPPRSQNDEHQLVMAHVYQRFGYQGCRVVDIGKGSPYKLSCWQQNGFRAVCCLDPDADNVKAMRRHVDAICPDITSQYPWHPYRFVHADLSTTQDPGRQPAPVLFKPDIAFCHFGMSSWLCNRATLHRLITTLRRYMDPQKKWRLVLTYAKGDNANTPLGGNASTDPQAPQSSGFTCLCDWFSSHGMLLEATPFLHAFEPVAHNAILKYTCVVFRNNPLYAAANRAHERTLLANNQSCNEFMHELYRYVLPFLEVAGIASFCCTFRWARPLVLNMVRLSDQATKRKCPCGLYKSWHGRPCCNPYCGLHGYRSHPCIGNYRLPRFNPQSLALLFHLFGKEAMCARTWYFEGFGGYSAQYLYKSRSCDPADHNLTDVYLERKFGQKNYLAADSDSDSNSPYTFDDMERVD